MNKEIKDRWVAALNSGKYKQGFRRLKRNETVFKDGDSVDLVPTHCCLGVLCEIAAEDGLGKWNSSIGVEEFLGCGFNLSDKVKDWAGLNGQQLALNELAFRNDHGTSFSEISKMIEVML